MKEKPPIEQMSTDSFSTALRNSLPSGVKIIGKNIYEFMLTKWSKSPFCTVERRARFYEWLLHNIIYGFACVWVPALFLAFFGQFKIEELLRSGDLPMFAVTVSAVSLGFFVKESQVSLRKTEMLTYAGLMLAVAIGIITRIALAASALFHPSFALSITFTSWMTTGLLVLAIGLNYKLFTLELQSVDPKEVENKINAPASALSSQAAVANNVDDIKL